MKKLQIRETADLALRFSSMIRRRNAAGSSISAPR